MEGTPNRPPDHVTHFGSFCDEFGHADDPRKKYLGIAGLLGRSDKWAAFDLEWKKIQQEEHIPNPFHMTDFVHQTEEFKDGWGSYVRGDPADFSPLQAADIWAYSLGHMAEHQPAKKKEAQIAHDFFLGMALQNVSTGRFFMLFNRDEMLARLWEPADAGTSAGAAE